MVKNNILLFFLGIGLGLSSGIVLGIETTFIYDINFSIKLLWFSIFGLILSFILFTWYLINIK